MKNVFLDLEGTVVDNWDNAALVHTSKVCSWLQGLGVSKVRLFSFAVYDQRDKDRFNSLLKPFLQRVLGVEFLDSPSVDDFLLADTQVTGVKWDTRHDFIRTRGKLDGFRSWCKLNFDKQHNVLLDDVVPNATWKNDDSGLVVQFVNVETLK